MDRQAPLFLYCIAGNLTLEINYWAIRNACENSIFQVLINTIPCFLSGGSVSLAAFFISLNGTC